MEKDNVIFCFFCVFQVNLSPALGNDCDIDPIVKKPMLHDMFDLLGLPLCNTGLSLFTLWSTSSNETHPDDLSSSENEDFENENGGTRVKSARKKADSPALSVVTAASKWKRRHQQKNHNSTQSMSAQRTRKKSAYLQVASHHSLHGCSGTVSSCSQMPTGRKSRTQTTGTRNPIKYSSINQNIAHNSYPPTASAYVEDDENNHKLIKSRNSQDPGEAWTCYNPLLIDRSRNQVHGFHCQNRNPLPMLWGNGRDWTSPPAGEGNWVRLYPLGPAQFTKQEPQELPTTTQGDKQVKNVVAAVHKYSKAAREIFKRNPTFSDELFSTIMKKTLGMTSEVWLPSK
jgi:hypothetical protein